MADEDRVSFRFNQDEEALKNAFLSLLTTERKRDKSIAKGDVAKALLRRGLDADGDQNRAAAIAENQLAIIQAQVSQISQSVRQIEATMTAVREDLATTVLVLLEHAGKLSSENAKKWVEEQFNG